MQCSIKKLVDPNVIQAFILAGGLGTRLRSVVSDRQKVVAEVQGRPFITILFDQLIRHGIRDVVLCAGFRGSDLQKHFGNYYNDLRLTYSIEKEPLGTAGALKLAERFMNAETILVMNGDSYCRVDFGAFLEFHLRKEAVASILLTRVTDTSRFGRVFLDRKSRITHFEEKGAHRGEGIVNVGIYLLSRDVIQRLPDSCPASLEREVFPIMTGIFGYEVPGPFIDIGTPEDYARAGVFFAQEGLL